MDSTKYLLLNGVLAVTLFIVGSSIVLAGDSTLDKRASDRHLSGVSISPDGRYLALIVSSGNDVHYVATLDRQQPVPAKPVMQLDPKQHTSLKWCKWAKNDRIVCNIISTVNILDAEGFRRQFSIFGDVGFDIASNSDRSRMIAFDYDGAHLNSFNRVAIKYWGLKSLLLADPDNVLMLLPDDATPTDPAVRIGKATEFGGVLPRIYRLNIRTGEIGKAVSPDNLVGLYCVDSLGTVRIVARNLLNNKGVQLFARKATSTDWVKIFDSSTGSKHQLNQLYPLMVDMKADEGYFSGAYEGHAALWKIDLSGSKDIELVFAQPGTDVHSIIGPDHQLLGVSYGTDNPTIKYFDIDAQILQDTADKALPNRNNQLVDFSRDMKVAVVQSQIDRDQAAFYVLDMSTKPAHLTPVN